MKFSEVPSSPLFRQLEGVSYEKDGFVMFFGEHTDDRLLMFKCSEDGRYRQLDNITHNEGEDEIQIVWYEGGFDQHEFRKVNEEFDIHIFTLDKVI